MLFFYGLGEFRRDKKQPPYGLERLLFLIQLSSLSYQKILETGKIQTTGQFFHAAAHCVRRLGVGIS